LNWRGTPFSEAGGLREKCPNQPYSSSFVKIFHRLDADPRCGYDNHREYLLFLLKMPIASRYALPSGYGVLVKNFSGSFKSQVSSEISP
jgi:hypothetical protein